MGRATPQPGALLSPVDASCRTAFDATSVSAHHDAIRNRRFHLFGRRLPDQHVTGFAVISLVGIKQLALSGKGELATRSIALGIVVIEGLTADRTPLAGLLSPSFQNAISSAK